MDIRQAEKVEEEKKVIILIVFLDGRDYPFFPSSLGLNEVPRGEKEIQREKERGEEVGKRRGREGEVGKKKRGRERMRREPEKVISKEEKQNYSRWPFTFPPPRSRRRGDR